MGALAARQEPPSSPPLLGGGVRRAGAPCRGGKGACARGAQKAPFVLCVPFVFFVLKNPAQPRAGDGVGGLMTPP
jgi:hypothetical protein